MSVVNAEKHKEAMAQELVDRVQTSFAGGISVLIGTYQPGQ